VRDDLDLGDRAPVGVAHQRELVGDRHVVRGDSIDRKNRARRGHDPAQS
jgi:hypothetical protein